MKLAWSRAHTLAAGIGLIVLTNAVALLGVAYNRSGEPDSRLELTQRELWQPYMRHALNRESGETTLKLRWRTFSTTTQTTYYGDPYFSPDWLDQEKLVALGFDLPPPTADRAGGRRYARLLPREVLVALELDGPAYRKSLERARGWAEKEAAGGAEPDPRNPATRGHPAADWLRREETSNSRLFAVDAGLDGAALRAKYADRTRYAIVRGNVRAQIESRDNRGERWMGRVDGIQNDQVTLPLELRRALESRPSSAPWPVMTEAGPPFHATIAFGKRFEPWVMAASPGQPEAAPSK